MQALVRRLPAVLKTFLAIALTFSVQRGSGQDTSALGSYLRAHRYAVDLSAATPFSMLPTLMEGRNILILGESGSHSLKLYDTLQAVITKGLHTQNLRAVLIEWGRARAYLLNRYMAGRLPGIERPVGEPDAFYPYTLFAGDPRFTVIGIDFERSRSFHWAVSLALEGLDTGRLAGSRAYIRRITDSSVSRLDEGQFHDFYARVSADFVAMDTVLRRELGPHYDTLKYLCTNPNNTERFTNRNPALANSFLQAVMPLDTGATYFCEIGGVHAWPGIRFSMAGILSRKGLSNRILVMSTFCDSCYTAKDGVVAGGGIPPLRGVRLECMRRAAVGSITLFDLSSLPDKLGGSLRKYGHLVLYVRGHD